MKYASRYAPLFAAAIFLGASPVQATAIDYVTAYSTALGSPSIIYDSANGLTTTCCGNFVTQNSSSSTPSTNVLGLTAASNSVSATYVDANNGNRTSTASASAYANLATGTIGALAIGSAFNGSTIGPGTGTAGAEIQDTITFTNTTGKTADIDVYWTFDGTAQIDNGNTGVDILFCLTSNTGCQGGPSQGVHGPINGGQFFRLHDSSLLGLSPDPLINEPTTAQWVSTTFTQGINADSGVFHGVFALPSGVSTDSLNAFIALTCSQETCDFSHTGALSFGGVGGTSGVSFTSASGVLLTATTSSPEPGTWVMMAAGLGLMLTGRARRRLHRDPDVAPKARR